MSLNGGAIIPMDLIKREKSRINRKYFPRDTKCHIRETAINNGLITHVVQILHEKRDGKCFSK